MKTLRVGTRGSDLALTQTRGVCAALHERHPECAFDETVIKTHGDLDTERPFDASWPVGSFVSAIERALVAGRIDLAVHSCKDLPSAPSPGLVFAAIPPREAVHDVLVVREGLDLDRLPAGFRIATSSPRRRAQAQRLGDVTIVPVRGNVPTRIAKLATGAFDGVILAAAGLHRLGITPDHAIVLPPERFVPAPGQGALVVQARAGDPAVEIASALDDGATRRAVTAERSLLRRAEAGCQTPIGAWATIDSGRIELRAQLYSDDGEQCAEGTCAGTDPERVGRELAERLMGELRVMQ